MVVIGGRAGGRGGNNPFMRSAARRMTNATAKKNKPSTTLKVNGTISPPVVKKTAKLDGLDDHAEHKSKWVNINVAGASYILERQKLLQHPNTLLGSMDLQKFYRPDLSAYYFDRNREAFDAIVNYYLSGGHIPYLCDTMDEGLIIREFDYFRIPLTHATESKSQDSLDNLNVNQTRLAYWKSKIWSTINVPESSTYAACYAMLDCFLILVSISFLVLETEPDFKSYFLSPSNPYYYYIYTINCCIMAFFTLDYLARLWSTSDKGLFLKQLLPWLDILSILPFYLELLLLAISGTQDETGGQGYVVLRVCRVFRVIRVFKLARRSENLLILVNAVGNTSTELFILFIMVFMVVMMFGSIMYTVEKTTDKDSEFKSIMMGCWWSVITVTTVGYGDIVPTTGFGMVLGSIAMLVGMIGMALPITVIVTKFSDVYECEQEKKRYSSVGNK